MSTTAELVEEEQAEYEAEGEREPEPEPDPEAGPDEPETEEPEAVAAIGPDEIAKAERARTAYRKKIGDILGEEAVAEECLLCAGLGHVPALPPVGVSFTVVETEDGLALAADEPPLEIEYRQASDKETCSECDGRGQTKTGAKAPAQEYWQCGVCGGAGWRPKVGAPPPAPADYVIATDPPQYPPPPAAGGVIDQWGRPFGHQHWGVPPAAIPG